MTKFSPSLCYNVRSSIVLRTFRSKSNSFTCTKSSLTSFINDRHIKSLIIKLFDYIICLTVITSTYCYAGDYYKSSSSSSNRLNNATTHPTYLLYRANNYQSNGKSIIQCVDWKKIIFMLKWKSCSDELKYLSLHVHWSLLLTGISHDRSVWPVKLFLFLSLEKHL